jgi:hypothetical protein
VRRLAFRVYRCRLGIVRIHPCEIVSMDRAAQTARVVCRYGEGRVARGVPVPFSELASTRERAVRKALALLSEPLSPPAPAAQIEHAQMHENAAAPAAALTV